MLELTSRVMQGQRWLRIAESDCLCVVRSKRLGSGDSSADSKLSPETVMSRRQPESHHTVKSDALREQQDV